MSGGPSEVVPRMVKFANNLVKKSTEKHWKLFYVP